MQNIQKTITRHLLLIVHDPNGQDRPFHVRGMAKPRMRSTALTVSPLASALAKACYSNPARQCGIITQLVQNHDQRLGSPTTAARTIGFGCASGGLQTVCRQSLPCTRTASKDFRAYHQHKATGRAKIGDTGKISSHDNPARGIICLDEFFCAHNTCMPGEPMPDAEDGAQSDTGRPRSDTFPDTNMNNHHDTRFPCQHRKISNKLRALDMCRLFKMTGDHV